MAAREKGPIAATISTLIDLQWVPVAADTWADHAHNQYCHIDGAPYVRAQLMPAIRRRACQIAWQRASQHYLGKGLGLGTRLLQLAQRAQKWLRNHGHQQAAKALELVVTLGFGTRVNSGQDVTSKFGMHALSASARCFATQLFIFTGSVML